MQVYLWLLENDRRSTGDVLEQRDHRKDLRDPGTDIAQGNGWPTLVSAHFRDPAVRARGNLVDRKAIDQAEMLQPVRHHLLQRAAPHPGAEAPHFFRRRGGHEGFDGTL